VRTMDCDSLDLLVSAYVDGELIGEEREAFEAHLRQCRRCRGAVDEVEALLALMQEAGPLHRASPALREAASRVLSPPSSPPARRWPWVMAAGLLLAVAASAWREWPGRRQAEGARAESSEFASLGADTHLRHVRGQLPLEVHSERAGEVAGWFAGRVPFNLTLPDYPVGSGERKPYELVGGRLVGFHGDYAAYVVYRMEDRPISLLVASAAAVLPRGGTTVTSGVLTFHLETVAGLKVISWTHRGLTYALVSDLPEDGARSCLVCHGTDPGGRRIDRLRRQPTS
jgi:anti-sigma factor RsiW